MGVSDAAVPSSPLIGKFTPILIDNLQSLQTAPTRVITCLPEQVCPGIVDIACLAISGEVLAKFRCDIGRRASWLRFELAKHIGCPLQIVRLITASGHLFDDEEVLSAA